MNKAVNAMIFSILGAVVGSVATYFYMNKKINQMVDEEVSKCTEYYDTLIARRENERMERQEKEQKLAEYQEAYNEYQSKAQMYDYNAVTKVEEEKLGDRLAPDDIEIFNENDYNDYHLRDADYETVMWTYYDDKILADDMDVIDETIGDIKDFIGNLDLDLYFETASDDVVYIRNHIKQMDIEIARSLLTFDEFLNGR